MKKLVIAALAMGAFATANAQLLNNQVKQVNYNGRASDQSTMCLTVTIPNILVLSPNTSSASITLDSGQTFNVGGSWDLNGSPVNWTVRSNREWFLYYQTNANTVNIGSNYHPNWVTYMNYSPLTGDNVLGTAYDDGDENTNIPIGQITMRITNNHTNGNITNGYGNVGGQSLVHASGVDHNSEGQSSLAAGTELLDEAGPTPSAPQYWNSSFSTTFTFHNNGSYPYAGGVYSATIYLWAIQE
jgi:hypothetical protein